MVFRVGRQSRESYKQCHLLTYLIKIGGGSSWDPLEKEKGRDIWRLVVCRSNAGGQSMNTCLSGLGITLGQSSRATTKNKRLRGARGGRANRQRNIPAMDAQVLPTGSDRPSGSPLEGIAKVSQRSRRVRGRARKSPPNLIPDVCPIESVESGKAKTSKRVKRETIPPLSIEPLERLNRGSSSKKPVEKPRFWVCPTCGASWEPRSRADREVPGGCTGCVVSASVRKYGTRSYLPSTSGRVGSGKPTTAIKQGAKSQLDSQVPRARPSGSKKRK